MTRYDLKKFVDVSVGHFSTTMQSHIYKMLTDLEQERWVEKNFIEQEGEPNRKKYSIIKTVRAELRRGMTALETRIKTAAYPGWSEAWNKYNSERTSNVLDELFGMAQVVDKHRAPVALRWLTALPYWLYRDRSAMNLPETEEGDRERRCRNHRQNRVSAP